MTRILPNTLALLLLSAPLGASAQQANPFEGDSRALRAGGALFANRCADCHAADAKGFSGPDLTLLWAEGTSDERVFEILREGVSGSIMPSSTAPDQELWAIVAYLKSLSTVPEFLGDIGDAERGSELFEARCTRCHRIEGNGARLGPDLTLIGRVRTRDQLIQAIREPGSAVSAGFRPVTVVTAAGERIRGIAKSEDAFSLQIMDTRQELRGYLKATLSNVLREDGSLMPTFTAGRLPQPELDDIVRYLGTRR
jgi:putative heme-binding domain-containing protein